MDHRGKDESPGEPGTGRDDSGLGGLRCNGGRAHSLMGLDVRDGARSQDDSQGLKWAGWWDSF